jgi:hypothetical protein
LPGGRDNDYPSSINNNKKELTMTTTITIGRKLIPAEHIALIEPVEPAALARMQTDRPFKARVVMIDRESVLTEQTAEDFAKAHGFRWIMEDGVGANPAIRFGVESFSPMDGFRPSKPYRSRLIWRDFDGNTQSKLFIATPEIVLAVAVTGEPLPAEAGEGAQEKEISSAPARRRRKPREREPAAIPA